MFLAVAEAAQERQAALALFIDEVQYFSGQEFSALIMDMHKLQQVQLPLVLVGAGLPILPGLVGESKSYAERLFSFSDIGPLSEPDAAKALRDPTKHAGVEFDDRALSIDGPGRISTFCARWHRLAAGRIAAPTLPQR